MPDAPKDAKSIFLAAVEIADAAERAAFVERSCGDDAALRKRVDDLLRAYGQPDGPLDKLAAALASTEIAEPIREQVGATIGPYKLMEQIGEGGFGLVFVAEQQQPIRRKVALKIIKPGMDTRDVIARFEAERQALALMDHPNIARVLDAGTTASGRPYFVMELVRGMPITDYCDQSQLTPRERLSLFVDVCNAVQHAHQKGIIHRDIKPSNVLVTLHDDRPVVKVIDFGVAKALHQHLTEKTIYTRYAQMIGTPLYMSPEQAQMSGLDVDTRSDIYSLGVLLYELLTGTTPLDKRRIALAAYDELLKIIREEEAPKPSVRLSQSTDTLPSIAALRKTEPARLSKMFDGDVDWIAMKALEKDRARRYETANAFAADVLRYLNDEPVEASPPSTAYRLRKFARRHRTALVTGSGFATFLIAATIVSTMWMIMAMRARQAAAAAEQRAIEALQQMKKERDAKQAALNAEAAQRVRAELQLANGLLRPIGFSTEGIDPAELRSFVDWSAIKESPLKMRVLEIALENPETAIRVARRAERVVQSCVGLSPTRRAQAIKLVSARQSDSSADPRIRVAACWLGLELGSADLPTWTESCHYLSDPKRKSGFRFAEFVEFATEHSDARQVAILDMHPLISILEKSRDEIVATRARDGLARFAVRGNQPQFTDVAASLISILHKPANDVRIQNRWYAANVLTKLIQRLEREQASDVTDRVIELAERSSEELSDIEAHDAFAALSSRMDPPRVKRATDVMIARIAHFWAVRGLAALAPRLQSSPAKCAWDALVASQNHVPVRGDLAALADRLDASQARLVSDQLIASFERPTLKLNDDKTTAALAAILVRMDAAQVTRAGEILIANVAKPSNDGIWLASSRALAEIAARVENPQRVRAADVLIAILQKSDTNSIFHSGALEALVAVTARLGNARFKGAADILVAAIAATIQGGQPVLPGTDWQLDKNSRANAIAALAPRLEPAQARVAWKALTARSVLPPNWLVEMKPALEGLAARLDSREVPRSGRALMEILQKSTEGWDLSPAAIGLAALAPRLEPAQVHDHWNAMLENMQKWPHDYVEVGWQCTGVLAQRLDPAPRNELSTRAATIFLDSCSFDDPVVIRDDSGFAKEIRSQEIASAILSPKSLAKLLSHPACVVERQEDFLKRFEELVLYDGKPVFLKPDATDGKKAAAAQLPQRRFHNLHDAAAWIQKNWPDFDLETNCAVTWRGSR